MSKLILLVILAVVAASVLLGCATQQPVQKTAQQVEVEIATKIGRSCLQFGYFYIDEYVFLCSLQQEEDIGI